MERIYFLVETVDQARSLLPEIRALGIEEDALQVIAKYHNLALEPLPEADLATRSNLINAARRGAVTGGGMGLLGGVLMATFPPAGIALGGGAILAATAAGTVLGTWMSTLVGVGISNEDLDAYQARIDQGAVMILVDVDEAQGQALESLVLSRHPEVVLEHGQLDDDPEERLRA